MKKEVLKEEVDQIIAQSFWVKSGVLLSDEVADSNVPKIVEAKKNTILKNMKPPKKSPKKKKPFPFKSILSKADKLPGATKPSGVRNKPNVS